MTTTDRELAVLRRDLEAEGIGPGRFVPPELRERATAWTLRRRRDGESFGAIAVELGVARETVRRWAAESTARRPAAKLVPVRVERAEARQRLVAVVSPSGFRVEGLTLPEAAAMLRALG